MWAQWKARAAALWARLNDIVFVRWLTRAVRGFLDHQGLLNASALTYTTLLTIVPLLAVVLAILKGFGFESYLRPFLLKQVPVLQPEVVDQMLAYIGRANAQAVGSVGLIALFLSVLSMLGAIENTLNNVFGVTASRGFARRIGEYVSMLVVGSVMIVLSIVLQTVLRSPALLERFVGSGAAAEGASLGLLLLPWVSVIAGLAFLYSWLPNTKVRLRNALIGGLVGGTLFQLVQIGYLRLQFGFGRYNAIYGALAQLPILLVWIYASWAVVLIGAEAAAARRALSTRRGAGWLDADGAPRVDVLGWLVLRQVLDAFRAGQPTPTADQAAIHFGAPVRNIRRALDPLIRAGLLVEPDDDHGYLPASAPASVSLERLLESLPRAETPPG